MHITIEQLNQDVGALWLENRALQREVERLRALLEIQQQQIDEPKTGESNQEGVDG